MAESVENPVASVGNGGERARNEIGHGSAAAGMHSFQITLPQQYDVQEWGVSAHGPSNASSRQQRKKCRVTRTKLVILGTSLVLLSIATVAIIAIVKSGDNSPQPPATTNTVVLKPSVVVFNEDATKTNPVLFGCSAYNDVYTPLQPSAIVVTSENEVSRELSPGKSILASSPAVVSANLGSIDSSFDDGVTVYTARMATVQDLATRLEYSGNLEAQPETLPRLTSPWLPGVAPMSVIETETIFDSGNFVSFHGAALVFPSSEYDGSASIITSKAALENQFGGVLPSTFDMNVFEGHWAERVTDTIGENYVVRTETATGINPKTTSASIELWGSGQEPYFACVGGDTTQGAYVLWSKEHGASKGDFVPGRKIYPFGFSVSSWDFESDKIVLVGTLAPSHDGIDEAENRGGPSDRTLSSSPSSLTGSRFSQEARKKTSISVVGSLDVSVDTSIIVSGGISLNLHMENGTWQRASTTFHGRVIPQ